METYRRLEKEYAKFVGSAYAVSCNSGTSALHLALLALKVGKGDEVIVPDFTMAACAFAVSYTSATPVFADVSPETYAIEPHEIERLITKKTKAIMVVHLYGRLAPMQAILKIARKHKIPVIEDACEAQGAVYKSKADLTVYSFYRNKIIAAEEGGMVTTDNKKYAERIAYFKNMAFDTGHTYFHKDIGYNYRMANSQALLALKNLAAYPTNAMKRRKIETWYNEYLPMPKRDAVWFYEAFVSPKAKKAILKTIPTARACFKPLSSFPMYGGDTGRPVARRLANSLVLLPANPELNRKDVHRMCDAIKAVGK